jgi:hypothetical protein
MTAMPNGTFCCHIQLSGLGELREQNKLVGQAEAVTNVMSAISKIMHQIKPKVLAQALVISPIMRSWLLYKFVMCWQVWEKGYKTRGFKDD